MTAAMLRLCQNKPLWERAASFLWDTLHWVHPQRLSQLVPEMPLSFEKASPRLQRFAFVRLGITSCIHPFPVDDGSRFLLLDEVILRQLALWLGALAYTRPLRSVMKGDDVRHLKTAFPGIYPEVLHELGWFLPDLPRLQAVVKDDALPSPDALEQTGWQLLFAHLSHLPEALIHRFRLRFPLEMDTCWHIFPLWQTSPEHIVLLQRLLKRISLGGYDLCCC